MIYPYALILHIDGSALRNPGKGGMAGIAEFPEELEQDQKIVFQDGYKLTTNNRMELRACLQALEYVAENARKLKISRAVILTDSTYVYDNQGRTGFWRKQGWVSREGKPIENYDLWRTFMSKKNKAGVRVDICYEKGKTTDVNKLVDKLAKGAAKNPTKVDFGYRPGKIGRSLDPANKSALLYPADSQHATINIYEKRSLGKGCNTIAVKFNIVDDGGGFVGKFKAFAKSEIAHRLHRRHQYIVGFDNNPNNPCILSAEPVDGDVKNTPTAGGVA
jgi:ribonuclease HI